MTDRALRMLYREIPPVSPCKAGCSDCCGPVPWSDTELATVRDDIPPIAVWTSYGGVAALMNPLTGKCPFASADGCAVYDRRPFMCRIFASTNDTRLTCPHGACATRPLTITKARALTERYKALPRANGEQA